MNDQIAYQKPSFEVVDVRGCINSWGSGTGMKKATAAVGEEIAVIHVDKLHAIDVFGTIIIAATGTQKGVQNVRLTVFANESGNTGFQLVGDTTPSETPTSFEVWVAARGADVNRGGFVRVASGGTLKDVKVTPITDLLVEVADLGHISTDEVIGVSSGSFDIDSAFIDGLRKLQRQKNRGNVAATLIETRVVALTIPITLNFTAVRLKSA